LQLQIPQQQFATTLAEKRKVEGSNPTDGRVAKYKRGEHFSVEV
jgi:hypothetical protein